MSKEFFQAYSSKLTYKVENLDNCEQEAITKLGAIQSAGYFLAIHVMDLEVIAASENLAELLGFPVDQLLGKHIDTLVAVSGISALTADTLTRLAKSPMVETSFKSVDGIYQASIFASSQHFCIDFEKFETAESGKHMGNIQELVSNLSGFDDMSEVAHAAAVHMKKITGIDRVMVYKFLSNHDGEVIAESREDANEPYLHLRYPAADIPAQARHLYLNSKYRMIVDVNAMPVAVQTIVGVARRELDLSCSHLRASSPIHIKYLQNMGVRSSFSVPIKLNNKLWGLFSCHHYSGPLHIGPEIRAAADLSAQIFSSRLTDFVAKRRLKAKNATLILNQDLLNSVATGKSPVDAFAANAEEVLALTRSAGAYVRIAGASCRLGDCPPDEFVQQLLKDLSVRETQTSWQSDSLRKEFPNLAIPNQAAGALAIPLSLGFEDSIIWFRPEVFREIRWGGKPPERDQFGAIKTNLEPRASFKAYAESVADHSEPWTEEDEDAAQYLFFSFVQGIFAKASQLSRAYQELEKVAKAKDEFIGLVSHELRTPLGVILGWVDIMKDFPEYSPDLTEAIKVVERNAKLQISLINDLLDISRIISGKMRIDPQANLNITLLIGEVVEGLLPTARAKSIALRWTKPADVFVTGDADRLRQVIYNLMNNAIKFTPRGGTVTVALEKRRSSYQVVVEDSGVGIDPAEINGVFDRFVQVGSQKAQHQGLGLGLSIVKAIAELHGGRVYVESEGLGKGTRFTMSLPIYALAPQAEEEHFTPVNTSNRTLELKGLKFLIAEDQVDSAKALQFTIERYGGEAHVVHNGLDAFTFLSENTVDMILSDVGMPNMNGYELLTAWRKLEEDRRSPALPAIALTAYARPKDRALALEAGFHSHIAKPVDRAELLAVIRSLRKIVGR
ncbi:MAG: hybrid sensor histidine kinase/response regulator [Proteobacteria bacterium]|nr:MAG: hybrid sensor histidine kinase/response regulator [Pseudomonadota bacterium]